MRGDRGRPADVGLFGGDEHRRIFAGAGFGGLVVAGEEVGKRHWRLSTPSVTSKNEV